MLMVLKSVLTKLLESLALTCPIPVLLNATMAPLVSWMALKLEKRWLLLNMRMTNAIAVGGLLLFTIGLVHIVPYGSYLMNRLAEENMNNVLLPWQLV